MRPSKYIKIRKEPEEEEKTEGTQNFVAGKKTKDNIKEYENEINIKSYDKNFDINKFDKKNKSNFQIFDGNLVPAEPKKPREYIENIAEKSKERQPRERVNTILSTYVSPKPVSYTGFSTNTFDALNKKFPEIELKFRNPLTEYLKNVQIIKE